MTENKSTMMDMSVLEINLSQVDWIAKQSGQVQFEEQASGSSCSLSVDKPLNAQLIRLPEGYISAALFFSYFPEDIFKTGPSHPDWYQTFALTSLELWIQGVRRISGIPG